MPVYAACVSVSIEASRRGRYGGGAPTREAAALGCTPPDRYRRRHNAVPCRNSSSGVTTWCLYTSSGVEMQCRGGKTSCSVCTVRVTATQVVLSHELVTREQQTGLRHTHTGREAYAGVDSIQVPPAYPGTARPSRAYTCTMRQGGRRPRAYGHATRGPCARRRTLPGTVGSSGTLRSWTRGWS